MSATTAFLDALQAAPDGPPPVIEFRLTENAAWKADLYCGVDTTYVPELDVTARKRMRLPGRDWLVNAPPRCYVLLLTPAEIAALLPSARTWCPELYNLLQSVRP